MGEQHRGNKRKILRYRKSSKFRIFRLIDRSASRAVLREIRHIRVTAAKRE